MMIFRLHKLKQLEVQHLTAVRYCADFFMSADSDRIANFTKANCSNIWLKHLAQTFG